MVTVLGAGGFVGSNLVKLLKQEGREFFAPGRDEDLTGKELGDVIYCIGLTADFRSRPFDTVEAHVSKLSGLLQKGSFSSLTYLSSTRVYIKSKTTAAAFSENDDIVINPGDAFDLFAASKLTGELLALNSGRDNIKVARLSNVFGADLLSQNFISSVVNDALAKKEVELFTTPDSSKDYISVDDVCRGLMVIAEKGKGVYNLASGKNTDNGTVLNEIAKITGAKISWSAKAQQIIFKPIDVSKIKNELAFSASEDLIDSLPAIIAAYQQ